MNLENCASSGKLLATFLSSSELGVFPVVASLQPKKLLFSGCPRTDSVTFVELGLPVIEQKEFSEFLVIFLGQRDWGKGVHWGNVPFKNNTGLFLISPLSYFYHWWNLQ